MQNGDLDTRSNNASSNCFQYLIAEGTTTVMGYFNMGISGIFTKASGNWSPVYDFNTLSDISYRAGI
ncbi:hypothetical protein PNOK_0558200 [Pyrrhoderma noxium]|uniref:Uncharacterized protein n=1 Tax=Pyrrhoderma noxium TaxID=2282107 RepID=A0A286UGT4_9AGAM|nr:hypothetical protein PNOK_0558200 [Pyrrhoderma noxium]